MVVWGGYNYDPRILPRRWRAVRCGGRHVDADLYVGCAVRAVRPHRRLDRERDGGLGRIDFDTTLDTGGRYDPATDVLDADVCGGRAVRAF